MLSIPQLAQSSMLRPLDRITIRSSGRGTIEVRDGAGRCYLQAKGRQQLPVVIAGAMGTHVVRLLDAKGDERESLRFQVDGGTDITDDGGEFSALLTMLRYTMTRASESTSVLLNGRIYKYFAVGLRIHVHGLKGMKYFHPDLTSGLELFRDTQREDGMVWDVTTPRSTHANYADKLYASGDFIRKLPPGTVQMLRLPLLNDTEFLFIEGIYATWKATGDDAWMKSMLAAAIKAVRYATSDACRWSEKFKLLKRGYTIDTWDFHPRSDAQRTGHPMLVDPVKTAFGVFHGDNTGMRASLQYLAEMLQHAGKRTLSKHMRALSAALQERLDALAWNGRFYRHHVAEDPALRRDLGVDLESQLSMSNAYALNRGISQDQCRSIIEEYQRIRDELPSGSAGEWYCIYPWSTAGIDVPQGEGMNGGVATFAAGELAHGALEHGFESYGVDILRRLARLASLRDGQLSGFFRGHTARPERQFTSVNLDALANVDFSGDGATGVPGWTGEGANDLHEFPVGSQVFQEIPFTISDPRRNGGRGCIGISERPGYLRRVEIPIGRTAKALYFLHALAGGSGIAGTLTILYADGTKQVRYVRAPGEILTWWMPDHPQGNGSIPKVVVAWEGANSTCPRVGVSAWGLDNPHPERAIASVVLEAAVDHAMWMVCGLTLSDHATWFQPSQHTASAELWGAAAVVYALLEGLSGVVDDSQTFEQATISPRWCAADVNEVSARIVYPASRGYVAYRYGHRPKARRISLVVTGSGRAVQARILLPAQATTVAWISVDGKRVPGADARVEGSLYALVRVDLIMARTIVISYR